MKTKAIKILTVFLILLSGCTIRLAPFGISISPKRAHPKRGRYYVVRRGDTLGKISKRYRISVKSIKRANRLRSDKIYVGQRLLIPKKSRVKKVVAKKTTKERKEIKVAKKVEKKSSIVKAEKGDFLWPAKGKVIKKFGKGNDGIDILLTPATKIVASKKGKVSFCGSTKGHGETIIIDHQDGHYTIYAHKITPQVEKGETVSRGATIAKTKGKKETFLHFEIRRGSEPVDPLIYLP